MERIWDFSRQKVEFYLSQAMLAALLSHCVTLVNPLIAISLSYYIVIQSIKLQVGFCSSNILWFYDIIFLYKILSK